MGEMKVFEWVPEYPVATIRLEDFDRRRKILNPKFDHNYLRGEHMLGERNGATLPVLIDEVLDALKKNREEHQEILEEAQAGYKEKVVIELEKALEAARKGEKYITDLNLQMPRSHLKKFDNAIDIVEAAKRAGRETVEMTASDYQRFIRNRWSWMSSFYEVASTYSATASGKLAEGVDDDY